MQNNGSEIEKRGNGPGDAADVSNVYEEGVGPPPTYFTSSKELPAGNLV